MANNKTFFKKAIDGKITLSDIFSEVGRKHTAKDSARVFIAGTELTTPPEAEMLSTWQKPFLFAKFLVMGLLFLALCYLFTFIHNPANQLLMLGICSIIPIALLLLVWEMNIPRNISLTEALGIVFIGGVLSLIITILLHTIFPDVEASTSTKYVGPIIEEIAKLIIVYVILSKKDYKYILNGVLIGMAVGTGFSVFEDFQYTFFNPLQNFILYVDEFTELGLNTYAGRMGLVLDMGIDAALVRAFTSIAGHGIYAALYGGALIAAKGKEPMRFSILTNFVFLKYFIFAVFLHMLNNSDLITLVYTNLFPNADNDTVFFIVYGIVMGVAALAVFLPLLRQGVDQVVSYVKSLNNDSLTCAVAGVAAAPAAPMGATVGVNTPVYDPVPTPNVGAAGMAPVSGGFIKFLSGPDTGKTYSFPMEREVTIGRAPQCEVALPNNSNVSSIHCTVRVCADALIITDKGSTNGTMVGSQRLKPNVPTPVPNDAIVYLGTKSCSFRFTRT